MNIFMNYTTSASIKVLLCCFFHNDLFSFPEWLTFIMLFPVCQQGTEIQHENTQTLSGGDFCWFAVQSSCLLSPPPPVP